MTLARVAIPKREAYGTPVSADEPDGITVPIAWLGVEDVPVLFANAFVCQLDEQTLDAITLTVGQLTPPALTGATREERQEQLRQVAYVPIKPVVRIGLTMIRARELVATLAASLQQLETALENRPPLDPR